MLKSKVILNIHIKVDDNYITDFTYYWVNHDEMPTNEIILKQFALHYHKAFGKSLPDSAEVISVKELLCQEEN